jgi:hypothetical protein
MRSELITEHLLLKNQDGFMDGPAGLTREPPPDGAGRDAHGSLQSARRPSSCRTATAVILVRVDGEGQYAQLVAAAAIRRTMPSRCSTSKESGSRGERCRAATRNVRPKSGWKGSTTVTVWVDGF